MNGNMKESNFPQPSSEQLAGLQEGDPLVANEIVELVLPSILRWAWTQYKLLPQDDIQDIVHQVLAEICHHYARYDPGRVLFTTYVIGLLKLRLADLYAPQQEIHGKEGSGSECFEN